MKPVGIDCFVGYAIHPTHAYASLRLVCHMPVFVLSATCVAAIVSQSHIVLSEMVRTVRYAREDPPAAKAHLALYQRHPRALSARDTVASRRGTCRLRQCTGSSRGGGRGRYLDPCFRFLPRGHDLWEYILPGTAPYDKHHTHSIAKHTIIVLKHLIRNTFRTPS
jgi:hypothetical protein